LAAALVFGQAAWAGLDFPFATPTQAEYAPGETAVILGYEFAPGQELLVRITRPDRSITDARGRNNRADAVTADEFGQFRYEYSQLDLQGYYYVDVLDASSVGKGKNRPDGTVLASTVFKDNITTDLELVGMPDAAFCTPPRDPAHGPHDGLVDALAGRCLVGTVDVAATGSDDDVRGFFFDLDIDLQSIHQGPGNSLLDFIDRLETVDVASSADPDTGSAPAPDGTGTCVAPCFYTTSGNSVIPSDGTTVMLTSLDGTNFDVSRIGPGNMAGEDRYRVTVSSVANPNPVTEARFEYCARINVNAGDADNGTDGFITSDPETGGTEASPINVCRADDPLPPICELTVIECGIEVFISDPESGIASIVVRKIENGTIDINPTPPTMEDVLVVGTKTVCEDPGNLELEITNGVGLVTICDPVDFWLVRGNDSPRSYTFPLNENEGYLRIDNNGLSEIRMDLNGNKLHFSVNGGNEAAYDIPETGVVEYDLTEFLLSGENSVEIRAVGSPGGSARITLHD
jgi:hypothetical protein